MPTTETIVEHGSTKKITTRQQVGVGVAAVYELSLSR